MRAQDVLLHPAGTVTQNTRHHIHRDVTSSLSLLLCKIRTASVVVHFFLVVELFISLGDVSALYQRFLCLFLDLFPPPNRAFFQLCDWHLICYKCALAPSECLWSTCRCRFIHLHLWITSSVSSEERDALVNHLMVLSESRMLCSVVR